MSKPPEQSDSSELIVEEGPAYTGGRTFRARAEARQRRFRSQVLRCGFERYGHVLSAQAAASGLNFIHPASWSAAKRRAARGRGVHVPRMLANMCSSQAMSFNLFGPLAQEGDLSIVSAVLGKYVRDLATVKRIQFAYVPPPEVFRDHFGSAGISVDLLIDYQTAQAKDALLSIEMKFAEPKFESCAMTRSRLDPPCHADLKIEDGFKGCRYVSQKGFTFWERTAQLQTLRPAVIRTGHCPFSGSLWQLWVHHTMVQTLGARQRAGRMVHAVCAPPGNESLAARSHVQHFSSLLSDPSSIVLIPLENFIEDLAEMVPSTSQWRDWINKARARYLID